MRRGRGGGFSCSKGFLVLLALLIYLDGQGIVLRALLACALHECGHWVVIRALGGRVSALRLSAVGAEMRLDQAHALSYLGEAAAALAGPAVNLLAAFAAARGGYYLFAGVNLCFGILNLVPAAPLDGGRALGCILGQFSPRCAETVAGLAAPVFAGGLLGLGAAAWKWWGNLSLLLVGLWLLIRTLKWAE